MQGYEYHEIVDCLPRGRTLYRYIKDYFAVEMLQRETDRHQVRRLAELKRGRYARLLQKPLVKSIVADCGGGELAPGFDARWDHNHETYVLTLGWWGGMNYYRQRQTSRPGYNLVLLLNFNRRHDRMYQACIGEDFDVFRYKGHPNARERSTMAWARMDIDLEGDEALIEEIQTDWLRMTRGLRIRAQLARRCGRESFRFRDHEIRVDRAQRYLDQEIARHESLWSEVTLAATIGFLFDEVGIGRIYYHTEHTGAAIKHIRGYLPPRSLYTRLPRQFCFDRVDESPGFLQRDKLARRRLNQIKDPRWFRLDA